MDHDDLKHFQHLAGSLSFQSTARARNLSPSALTRCIQRLEQELGVTLFERDRRHVRLTPAGGRFRTYAQHQLDAYVALIDDLRQEDGSPSGELAIAGTVTACYSVLPRLLASAREQLPRVAVKLLTQDATRSMQQLASGELDLAVVPRDDDEAESDPLAISLERTPLCFIAPAPRRGGGLARTLASGTFDWNDVPIVAPLKGLERDRLDGWLKARGVQPPLAAEVRGNEGIIAMVSLGAGVGLVPRLVLQASPLRKSVRVLSVEEPPEGYTVALCTRPRALERRAVAAFWGLARS